MSGADYAVHFWRKTVAEFTGDQFEEDVYQDEYWEEVIQQRFRSLGSHVEDVIFSLRPAAL
ncbi:MAG: hypothetical protein ACK5CA_15070 [Cyanobacteriota bacterium]|jgi:hypothetical protein